MTWLKVDDTFPSHRKVKRAGAEAIALWLAGCCYSSRHGTDGFLPSEDVPHLEWHAPGLPEQLVSVGLWEVAQGGYLIHDFLIYNPKADEVKAKKDAHAQQMRALRQRQKAGHADVPVTVAARDHHVISTCVSRDENVIDRSGLGDRARDHTVEFTVSGSDPVPEVQASAPISNPDPPSVDDTTRARGTGYSAEKACMSTSHLSMRDGLLMLTETSGGRFAVGPKKARGAHAETTLGIPQGIWDTLRSKWQEMAPDVDLVRRAGQWLAAGGWGFTQTITPNLLARNPGLHSLLTEAGNWDGRPIGKQQGNRGLMRAPKMIGEDRWLEDCRRMNAEDDEKCERDRQRLAAWRKDKDAAMAAGQAFDDDAWDEAWYAQHGGAPT